MFFTWRVYIYGWRSCGHCLFSLRILVWRNKAIILRGQYSISRDNQVVVNSVLCCTLLKIRRSPSTLSRWCHITVRSCSVILRFCALLCGFCCVYVVCVCVARWFARHTFFWRVSAGVDTAQRCRSQLLLLPSHHASCISVNTFRFFWSCCKCRQDLPSPFWRPTYPRRLCDTLPSPMIACRIPSLVVQDFAFRNVACSAHPRN